MSENTEMSYTYGKDERSAVDAKFEAQKIAFAPIMFQAARVMRNLGILDTIQDHRKEGITIELIAKKLKLSIYGVKVLVEAGLGAEILLVKEGKFFLTKTGWFLVNDKLTKVNMDYSHDVNYQGFFELEESITNGKPEGLKVFGDWETIYQGLSILPEKARDSWFAFDHYYSDISFPEIMPIIFENKPKKILDIGGNTGKFSIKCTEYNPDVKMCILDLPVQLKVANKNIKNKGLENRIETQKHDVLDNTQAFPKGFDIIWMSQFLDCFSQEQIVDIIKKAKDALSNEGALYIMELYWDKQKYEAATYSLQATSLYFTCLANGNSQMYHHLDMLKLIDKAGMKVIEEKDQIGITHTLYKCVKK